MDFALRIVFGFVQGCFGKADGVACSGEISTGGASKTQSTGLTIELGVWIAGGLVRGIGVMVMAVMAMVMVMAMMMAGGGCGFMGDQ